MGPLAMTQLATGLGVLASAAVVKSVMDQSQNATMGSTFRKRCATCNGTGLVSCVCSRWSDGDAGCRTCSGSRHMACSSCGGSGTGRLVPVRVSTKS